MPWDDDNVTFNGNSGTVDTTGTTGGILTFGYTSANTSAITGTGFAASSIQYVWTNYTSTTGILTSANTAGGGNYFSGGGVPIFDPVQVAALRRDFKDVKEDRKRKRAELRARKLFKRVVGDIAYEHFKKRGYHEIKGASGARYRLLPGRWVRVMEANADKVDYELCAHLDFGIPWFDTMAVQHLMLTTSKETEEKFRSIANRHQVGYYPIEEMRHAG